MSIKEVVSANVAKRFDDLLSHITGNIATDALSGGRRGRQDKKGEIQPLSYKDNAAFMRLLARVADKFFSTESPDHWLIQRNRFTLLLNQAARKFLMNKVRPESVWNGFLEFLLDNIDPRLQKLLTESIEARFPGRDTNSGRMKIILLPGQTTPPLEPRLKAQLQLMLALPFMRLVNQQSESDQEGALNLIKRFVELGSDRERFAEYQTYLASLEQLMLKSRSPLIVWPRFLRFMFDNASEPAKEKLRKRAEQGVKLLSHHMSVYRIEKEAIQWLANPFIETVTEMMEQSVEDAEQVIKQFCELPTDEARLEAYMSVMAQPERHLDILKRWFLGIREMHEQEAEQTNASGQTATSVIDGWLARARQFNQQS